MIPQEADQTHMEYGFPVVPMQTSTEYKRLFGYMPVHIHSEMFDCFVNDIPPPTRTWALSDMVTSFINSDTRCFHNSKCPPQLDRKVEETFNLKY